MIITVNDFVEFVDVFIANTYSSNWKGCRDTSELIEVFEVPTSYPCQILVYEDNDKDNEDAGIGYVDSFTHEILSTHKDQ